MTLKIRIILILLFPVINNFAQNSIKAHISVPQQIKEGQSFTEIITISKPADLRSYAVLTQQIPKGFFIDTKDISGATISFQNNILTITWMRLPAEKSIGIPVKLSYINGISGTFSLSGNLTYLVDNEKGEFILKKKYFTISSEKILISKSLNEYTHNYKTFSNIKCLRILTLHTDKSYSVELIVKNLPSADNFILTEEVSEGFEITDADNISSNKRIVQFKINNTKNKKNNILNYRLTPNNKNIKKQPVIFGKLSFIYQGQIINIPVKNQP